MVSCLSEHVVRVGMQANIVSISTIRVGRELGDIEILWVRILVAG